MPFWESNHGVCKQSGLLIFKHLINKNIISHLFNITNSDSPCIAPLKMYLLHNSFMIHHISHTFKEVYQINDVLSNDLDAIKSRIIFVQNNKNNV